MKILNSTLYEFKTSTFGSWEKCCSLEEGTEPLVNSKIKNTLSNQNRLKGLALKKEGRHEKYEMAT